MSQNDALIDLIGAFKKNDVKMVDDIINHMIDVSEERKQYKFAKKLREAYASPPKEKSTSLYRSSAVIPPTDNRHLFEIRKSKITSDQIVLSSTNKKTLFEIIENYKKRILLAQHGLSSDSRIILHGAPGTGKTLFAYVLAGELNLPIYHVYLDTLISSFLGETGKNLKIIFEEASREECVLLLDEFDAIAKHRDDPHELGELKRVVTVLLQNIDELKPQTILIAATNHEHLLDPAVWRRFAYSIEMGVLDSSARKALLNLCLGNGYVVDMELLADLSDGLSGAIIKQMIDRSQRKCVLSNGENLQLHLIESFLVANGGHSERLKGKKRDNFIRALRYLRESDNRKYTYEELEKITGMAASTIHNISSTK